ncbi:MAG: hypothetical protein JWL68_4735 [Actinomycetia bacterium]|nr:hypothetical protein [Actinomycetes bacterium]
MTETREAIATRRHAAYISRPPRQTGPGADARRPAPGDNTRAIRMPSFGFDDGAIAALIDSGAAVE